MQKNKHHSVKVQESYNKFQTLPIFSILIECDRKDVDSLEYQYIKEFDSYKYGLNNSEICGPNVGSAKYSKIQILKVFTLLINRNLSYEDIEKRTKVSIGSIKAIRRGVKHTWLQEEFPEKWALLKRDVVGVTSLAKQGKCLPTFISPTGEVYEDISNLRQFVSSLSFDNTKSAYRCFSAMYNKSEKCRSYKGWKLLI